jgi:uncharacterized membrane protein
MTLRFTASDYPFGILWPLCCLSFALRLLITSLVYCGRCVVCPSLYGFWLPLWYIVAIVLSVLRFSASDYPFGILLPLCCLSFALRLLITPLVSCCHCVVCPSLYGFWLSLWYLVALVKSEGQTTQWQQDTKGIIRSRKAKDRQHNGYKIPKG